MDNFLTNLEFYYLACYFMGAGLILSLDRKLLSVQLVILLDD